MILFYILDAVIAFSAGLGIRHYYAVQQVKAFIRHLETIPEKSEKKVRWEACNLIRELKTKCL